ncbi:MAG TPA: cache domain-containing protein [Acetobacteraceae bacterium]|nr:cache domain-containing protein [Acetobacteraceae bacterium]
MLALALAILVPGAVVSTLAMWEATERQQRASEDRLRDTVLALSLALDREIGGQIAMLASLATSPAFGPDPANPDLPALDAHARRVAALMNTHISVVARDGTRLQATALPPGAALPRSNAPAMIEQVFATGQPAVTDLVTGAIAGAPVFAVAVPVRDAEERVVLAVVAAFRVERLRDLITAQSLPPESFAAITDSRQHLVARSDALHERLVGQPVPPGNAVRVAGQRSGTVRTLGLDGMERLFAFHALASAPGWHVYVAQSAASLEQARRAPLQDVALGGLFVTILGTLLALLAARRILHPIEALGRHARAVATVEGPPASTLAPAPVAEVEALRQGFIAAEAALRRQSEGERAAKEALQAQSALLDAMMSPSRPGRRSRFTA